MTRIAFVHNNFPAGGAERVTADIASYLSSLEGYEVYIYASRISETLITEQMRGTFTLRKIPAQALRSIRAKEIERHITEDGIDVLVQVSKEIPGIEEIKKNTGVKTVVSCHGEPFWQRHAIVYRRQKGLVRKIMWNLYNKKRYEDGTLAMKKAVNRTLREYNNCDAYTVLCKPYKFETAEKLGLDSERSHIYPIENPEYTVEDVNYSKEKMVLFCGRFENWSKRIDRLLRIWAKVEPVLPDWKFVLVGDGRDGIMLRGLAEELGLKRVSFEGMQKDVSGYYRKASIVCLSSETEGWPLVLTEGQAQGCIGVAFDATSGIREILDGECGFVVPAFDEDKYAETLVRVACMDAEEQMKIRVNGVRRRSGYAPEIIADKWRKLFDMLVNQ